MLNPVIILVLLGVQLAVGVLIGWFLALHTTQQSKTRVPVDSGGTREPDVSDSSGVVTADGESISEDLLAELIGDLEETASRHRSGIERFTKNIGMVREDPGHLTQFETSLSAQRESNQWCLSLLDHQNARLVEVAPNDWAPARDLGAALDGYRSIVSDCDGQLEGEPSPDTAAIVLNDVLAANRQLSDSLAEAYSLVEEYDRRLKDAEGEARRDPLTGLPNRRAFDDHHAHLHATWERDHRREYGLLLIDIDFFKSINDRFGHDVGDRVLEMVGEILQSASRNCDHISRWGGEEFAILTANADTEGLQTFANRVRGRIAAGEFVDQGRVVRCTASIGMSVIEPGLDTGAMMKLADGALYRAKGDGRNCVRIAEQSPPTGQVPPVAKKTVPELTAETV